MSEEAFLGVSKAHTSIYVRETKLAYRSGLNGTPSLDPELEDPWYGSPGERDLTCVESPRIAYLPNIARAKKPHSEVVAK